MQRPTSARLGAQMFFVFTQMQQQERFLIVMTIVEFRQAVLSGRVACNRCVYHGHKTYKSYSRSCKPLSYASGVEPSSFEFVAGSLLGLPSPVPSGPPQQGGPARGYLKLQAQSL